MQVAVVLLAPRASQHAHSSMYGRLALVIFVCASLKQWTTNGALIVERPTAVGVAGQ
jgi:hypothetical protein